MHNQEYQPILDAIQLGPHYANEVCRLFHGRGHSTLNYLNLDYYSPYLFLVSYKALTDEQVTSLCQAVWQVSGEAIPTVKGLIFQSRAGQISETRVMYGDDPGQFEVCELGARYYVNLTKSQNTGIFPDMRTGREFVGKNSQGATVLNLFSYTCAFSVVAKRAGAELVVNMDMNKSVLRTGEKNHQLNQVASGVKFFPHDILKSFGKLKRSAPYDLIVVDPPSFQKGSFVLTKDYQKILRRLPELCHDKTKLLLCANSPELSEQAFKDLIDEVTQSHFQYIERLHAPDGFDEIDNDRNLKALVYHVSA